MEMHKDMAPAIIEAIRNEFDSLMENDEELAGIYKQVQEGKADYKTANKFAIRVGDHLATSFEDVLSKDGALPDNRMYYNIGTRLIDPSLKRNHELTADVCADVQTAINKKAGLGIKGVKPAVNQDRIDDLIDRVAKVEDFNDISKLLYESIRSFTQSVVDAAVKVNAQTQAELGLSPKIRRTVMGGCCKWCRSLAGTYDYDDVSNAGNNVFRRHNYCRCLVEFLPGDGGVQNVHTGKWTDDDTIEARKKIGVQGQKTRASLKDERKKKLKEAEKDRLDEISTPDLKRQAKELAMEAKRLGLTKNTEADFDAMLKGMSREKLKWNIRDMREKVRKAKK